MLQFREKCVQNIVHVKDRRKKNYVWAILHNPPKTHSYLDVQHRLLTNIPNTNKKV